jgi:processive 1,2-diacylglycerol beta-glucosyltransferase/1,2-diacylglycerol 3-beta-galactosyltransferase
VSKKKKYLFLYLKTGGGHLAPAKSISAYIEKVSSDSIETLVVDGFNNVPGIVRSTIEDGYRQLQIRAKWLYTILYAVNKIPFMAESLKSIITFFVKPKLEELIRKENPDKIIILHFFLIKSVYDTVKKLKLNIPVITIVTDPYTAHPLWFLRKDQNMIVFSERMKKHAIKKGIPEKGLNVFPFIIAEKFSNELSQSDKNNFKIKHGISPEKKTILIVGGGDGIPKGTRILRAIYSTQLDVNVAIVCGKNEELLSYANIQAQKHSNLKVYGFVDFIYELINISDVIITKCGASTIFEILSLKKVPVINDYLWEQEKGNVEFVRDNYLGFYEKNVKKLPKLINDIVENKHLYNSFRNNIENMKLKNGTAEVSNYIVELSS